jgi:tRNA threonylcarbamoyladenosine biosynthesis protein TsaB
MLLALETATDRASVAVGCSEERATVESVAGARRHAAALIPMVAAVLGRAGATLGDLTAVVVADGPGSFTGLRVGAAVAKALVQARGLVLWTAPSLMVRASAAAGTDGTVVAVADALRGDVYAAVYRFTGPAIVTQLPPAVCRPEELISRVPAPSVVVGEVSPAARELFERWSGRPMTVPPEGSPDAGRLLGLVGRPGGATRIAAAGDWEPTYGRPAEAQARWETTHGRPLPDSAGSPR